MTQESEGITTGFTGGGDETPLSGIRPYGMGVPSNEALDTSTSLHLTISYLLRIEYGDLKFQIC